MSTELHLIRLPVDAQKLYAFARRSRAASHDFDVGYALHALLTALFDHKAEPEDRQAPKPFFFEATGRLLDVYGYTKLGGPALVERANLFSDPNAFESCPLDRLTSRPMPTNLAAGKRLGFSVRVCPTRRVKKAGAPDSDKREVDAFLAEVLRVGDSSVVLDRQTVYQEWLASELGRNNAAKLEFSEIKGHARGKFLRRTQGDERKGKVTEKPDVTFDGVLEICDPAAFAALLARGVGRHRSFGFGMMLLKPPRGHQITPV